MTRPTDMGACPPPRARRQRAARRTVAHRVGAALLALALLPAAACRETPDADTVPAGAAVDLLGAGATFP